MFAVIAISNGRARPRGRGGSISLRTSGRSAARRLSAPATIGSMSEASQPTSGEPPQSQKRTTPPWDPRTPALRWLGMVTLTPSGPTKSTRVTQGGPGGRPPCACRSVDDEMHSAPIVAQLGFEAAPGSGELRLVLGQDDDRDGSERVRRLRSHGRHRIASSRTLDMGLDVDGTWGEVTSRVRRVLGRTRPQLRPV